MSNIIDKPRISYNPSKSKADKEGSKYYTPLWIIQRIVIVHYIQGFRVLATCDRYANGKVGRKYRFSLVRLFRV
ncbi:MAG TPA: hypothetical protein VKA91_01555 [Nitrososphaeraceae archaeon]|nr:hypothetical protein [Nitrososphaeraceae archaeon]